MLKLCGIVIALSVTVLATDKNGKKTNWLKKLLYNYTYVFPDVPFPSLTHRAKLNDSLDCISATPQNLKIASKHIPNYSGRVRKMKIITSKKNEHKQDPAGGDWMSCIFSRRCNRNTMIETGLRKCLATHVSGTVTKVPGQHIQSPAGHLDSRNKRIKNWSPSWLFAAASRLALWIHRHKLRTEHISVSRSIWSRTSDLFISIFKVTS